MRAEDDALIAELLLRRGWLDAARLQRAVEILQVARALDLGQGLIQVLGQKGFLGERELRELAAELDLEYLTRPEHSGDISGYRISAKLEPWGLGVVFAGLQLSMQRPVALKVLAPAAAKDAALLDRFLSEGRTAGKVDHPNILGALDLGRSGDLHYYSTELPEGRDLRAELRGGALPVARALHVARQVAQALAYLHELGITHRDVQPANILLLKDGGVKLRNVGATRLPGDPSVARTGIPIGTPGYSAPELVGPVPSADIRADIYALGATLYHCLTGHRPGRADIGPLLPPTVVREDIPRAVSDLVCRMTATDPGARFQDPGELLRAMDELARQQDAAETAKPHAYGAHPPAIAPVVVMPATAEPSAPSSASEAPKGRRRIRLGQAIWLAACAALTATLVVAGAWAFWPRHSSLRGLRPGAASELLPGKDEKVGTRPVPKAVANPPPPPAPVEPELPESDLRVIEEALAFDRENPESHGEALLRLRRALLLAGTTPLATKVRARLAIRQQQLSGQANSAYGELNDKLIVLRSQGRLGAALQACQAFPASLRWGVWGDLVSARFAELGQDAERHYVELVGKAVAALHAQRYDEALLSYKAIGEIGIPWMARAVEPLVAIATSYAEEQKARLKELAARKAILDRRKALGALTKPFALVHDEIKKRDYAKALEVCRAVSETLRDGERGKALAQLERRLAQLAELWDAILKGPPAAIGKPFSLHGAEWTIEGFAGAGINAQVVLRAQGDSGGRILRQPIWRLPAPQLGALAEWAVAKDPPGLAAIKVGLLYLTEGGEGAAAKARQKFQEAQKAGEDVTHYLDEMEAEAVVAGALTAYRQGKWAEARKLLESALDRYGMASPVILSHRALTNALADCLLKLGENADDAPAAPALPERLHWLLLLPETKLSSTPWPSPLEAHFGTPLRRSGVQRFGVESWRDYILVLEWDAASPTRVVLAARLAEPQPGDFCFYFVSAGDGQLVLGRRDGAGAKVLASKPCQVDDGQAKHRLTFSLIGGNLSAELDDGKRVEATDGAIPSGRVALAVPEGAVLVQELLVNLWPSARGQADPAAPGAPEKRTPGRK